MGARAVWLLVVILVGINAWSAGESPLSNKMCWAHYVSWGFNLTDGYDRAEESIFGLYMPYPDRSLLGELIQNNSGIGYGARKQIAAAMAYGVDGFNVDVQKPDQYLPVMSRFFSAAEGTDFKIALCMDGLWYPAEVLIEHLEKFISTYRNHPNACLVDGRMVIFMYTANGKTVDQWCAVREELRRRGCDAYFLSQPYPLAEITLWEDAGRIDDALRGFDGLFDFGGNGFTAAEIENRLKNAMAALRRAGRRDAILVGGVAPGYSGQFTAYYRPFLNSGSVRNNWEAVIASGAQWVNLTTWNDYIETTQFEPTVINRDNLLLLNQEYLFRWRGVTPPPRPVRVLYNYHEETLIGDDLTIEAINFSYTTAPSTLRLRLLGEDGNTVFHTFPDLALTPDRMQVETFRLRHDQLGDARLLRVEAAVFADGEEPQFRELYPIVRRYGRLASYRTIRLRHDDLSPAPAQLEPTVTDDGRPALRLRLNLWSFAGKVELLRHGYPVWESDVNHEKASVWERVIPLPEKRRAPRDLYLVRITDVADRIAFSNPVYDDASGFDAISAQPVVVSGADFDENWPMWRTPRSASSLAWVKVAEYERFACQFDFEQETGEWLESNPTVGWRVPARLGATAGNVPWAGGKLSKPKWVRGVGPDGRERVLLEFDGEHTSVALAIRSTPAGPFTLEAWINPVATGRPAAIFSDQNGIGFYLNEQLTPEVRRDQSQDRLVATEVVPENEWSHVAAVYTGDSLLLYRNGKLIGEGAAKPSSLAINSIPRLGNNLMLDAGFRGRLAGFRLESGVREPADFQLLR